MDFLKKYWSILILSIVIIGGAFYWFQFRPSQIRKNCYSNSRKSLDEIFGKTQTRTDAEISVDYDNCLRLNGLEK